MVKVPLNVTTGAIGKDRFSNLPIRVFIKEKPEGLVLDCGGKRYARRYHLRDFKMKIHKKLIKQKSAVRLRIFDLYNRVDGY